MTGTSFPGDPAVASDLVVRDALGIFNPCLPGSEEDEGSTGTALSVAGFVVSAMRVSFKSTLGSELSWTGRLLELLAEEIVSDLTDVEDEDADAEADVVVLGWDVGVTVDGLRLLELTVGLTRLADEEFTAGFS